MLSPYQQNEKWEYWVIGGKGGKQRARVTGRIRVPDRVKTWTWCLRNDYEQQVSEAPWYHPEWPQAKRELYWNYFRNPLQNARLYLWGVADRNYTVEALEGNPDPMVVQRDDVIGPDGKPEQGYQRARLHLDDGSTRDFVSYCNGRTVWQWGCQPSGFYGAKFNI